MILATLFGRHIIERIGYKRARFVSEIPGHATVVLVPPTPKAAQPNGPGDGAQGNGSCGGGRCVRRERLLSRAEPGRIWEGWRVSCGNRACSPASLPDLRNTAQDEVDEVLALVRSTPEQTVFDWKTDFVLPADDEKRGELIKDICAIANAVSTSDGFILYGVDPRKPGTDALVGITNTYDDSRLQQLVQGKVEPPVDFLYYEVSAGQRVIGVLQIRPTRRRPHIIRVDLGKIRKGQIVIRRGSSTDGVILTDLLKFFYGPDSGYFPVILERLQADVAMQRATAAVLRELRLREAEIKREMALVLGLPPDFLG